MKIKVYKKDMDFGPGVARIMQLVKETGTLSEAYRIMGISSSKAWKIIKKAERDLGIKLIVTVIGGSGGGKSALTVEGEDFLKRYHTFTKELDNLAKNLFEKYFACDIINVD
jgi:molybdate transport system regulatory protein